MTELYWLLIQEDANLRNTEVLELELDIKNLTDDCLSTSTLFTIFTIYHLNDSIAINILNYHQPVSYTHLTLPTIYSV